MITPKYVMALVSICSMVLFVPGIDTILSGVLIFMVGGVSVIVNLFFFWNPLRKILFKELLSQFYLQLYHNDEFIDFLVEKRNARKK